MSVTASRWAYLQKTGSPARKAVLASLAEQADEKTLACYPSQEFIAARTELSLRTVRSALKDLATLGLITRRHRGRAGVSGGRISDYYVLDISSGTGCRLTDVGQPATDVGQPATDVGQQATVAGEPSVEPSVEPTAKAGATAGAVDADRGDGSLFPEPVPVRTSRGDNKRAQELSKHYHALVPMSRFPAVMGVVIRAVRAGHSDEATRDALTRLAEEGRSVTVETLRIELEGLPARANRRTTNYPEPTFDILNERTEW